MSASTHLTEPGRTPLQSMVMRWPVAVALALVGLLIGVAAAMATPTTYTAESRLAVQAGGLSTGALAGLPLAASQLASNYARYLNDQSLSDDSLSNVSASPVPESNVIRVEGRAPTPSAARASADRAASLLRSRVQQSSGGSDTQILKRYSSASRAAARAQQELETAQGRVAALTGQDASSAAIDRARQQVVTSTESASTAQLRKEALGAQYQQVVSSASAAELDLINKAAITASDRVGRIERYGVLGLVLGLAAALLVVTVLDRRGTRRA